MWNKTTSRKITYGVATSSVMSIVKVLSHAWVAFNEENKADQFVIYRSVDFHVLILAWEKQVVCWHPCVWAKQTTAHPCLLTWNFPFLTKKCQPPCIKFSKVSIWKGSLWWKNTYQYEVNTDAEIRHDDKLLSRHGFVLPEFGGQEDASRSQQLELVLVNLKPAQHPIHVVHRKGQNLWTCYHL